MHYWPKLIRRQHSELIQKIRTAAHQQFGFSDDTLASATALHPLEHYTDTIETLLVTGLNDPILHTRLSTSVEPAILFTGGGIVPSKLLNIPDCKMLHVHPVTCLVGEYKIEY